MDNKPVKEVNMIRAVSSSKMDRALLQAVEQHPALYNPFDVKYMDGAHKNSVWIKIGEKLQSNSHSCKSRWYNIRDQYRKSLIKSATASDKKRKKYKYSKELSFLKCFYHDMKVNAQETDEEDRLEATEFVAASYDDTNSDIINQEDTKPMNQTGMAAEGLMEYVLNKFKLDNHPIDAFLAGITPTLKNLSHIYQNRAKTEIFDIVQKYEMKMFLEQDAAGTSYDDK